MAGDWHPSPALGDRQLSPRRLCQVSALLAGRSLQDLRVCPAASASCWIGLYHAPSAALSFALRTGLFGQQPPSLPPFASRPAPSFGSDPDW